MRGVNRTDVGNDYKKATNFTFTGGGLCAGADRLDGGGTLLRPQRVRVECREVEPWENRLERQSPAETEDFLRRGAREQGTFALEDLAQDAPG